MNKIPFLLIQNFFSPEEEALIWDELNFLNNSFLMLPPSFTGAATGDDGEIRKKNKGVFLSEVYKTPYVSSIWRCSRNIFKETTINYSMLHPCNKSVLVTNNSSLLVSYYENGDCYHPHRDSAVVTVLYWFFREPKNFTGGDLIFNDTEEKIEVTNNTMIMFPSWATHSVTPISLREEKTNKKLGRYCITHFLRQMEE